MSKGSVREWEFKHRVGHCASQPHPRLFSHSLVTAHSTGDRAEAREGDNLSKDTQQISVKRHSDTRMSEFKQEV